MLLDKPLESHPLEPNVELPPPSLLKRKIIIKNKKKHHHHHHHHKKGGAAATTGVSVQANNANNSGAGKLVIKCYCFKYVNTIAAAVYSNLHT